ncbi:Cyclic nucleotide-binding domain-containing protein 1, partial [Varanus komodoensis]
LDRLAGLGVGGTTLWWFRSYLNGRFQKVVLRDYGSVPWQLCHGVPQGSILSPLLFNIYMKPLGEVIRRCGLRNYQYADDTQLHLSFSTNPVEMEKSAHEVLEKSDLEPHSPILRSYEEHEAVYRTMKLIPDISEQLSDAEMRQLSTTVIREYWVKGSTVDASQGLYAILKGSARPQSKFYKKMVGGNFVLAHRQSSTTSASRLSRSSLCSIMESMVECNSVCMPLFWKLRIGCCFGTLEPLPAGMQQDVLTVVTDDNCDFLKIPSTDYLRVKAHGILEHETVFQDIAKREHLAKEELICGSPFYQDWPMVFIFQLTAHLKWRKFPVDHVIMKGGEISTYVGFIKSGCCNAYQTIPALVKRPLGKMIKCIRRVLIGELHPRESFGEISILLQVPSAYMLKAATPVELGIIEAADILDLDPVIQILLLQSVKPTFENITPVVDV